MGFFIEESRFQLNLEWLQQQNKLEDFCIVSVLSCSFTEGKERERRREGGKKGERKLFLYTIGLLL